MESELPDLDLAKALGAESSFSTRSINLYIPNRDRRVNLVTEQEVWIEEALRLLCEINGIGNAADRWRLDE